MGSEAYTLDEQVGFLMYEPTTLDNFQQHVPLGLTPPQFSVLIKVLELGSCSQNGWAGVQLWMLQQLRVMVIVYALVN